MSRLRSYAPMARRSEKAAAQADEFQAVYAVVDARSEGRCEFNTILDWGPILRCPRRASDHHHLYKPRLSHHAPPMIVHLCRHHHDRCEWPFKRGRLVISLRGGRFVCEIRFASDKFALRSGATAP